MTNELVIRKNFIVPGSAGFPMLTDVFYRRDGRPKPVVVYVHGFNGFKDWGAMDIIAQQFAQAGMVFVKFNLSHNGTSATAPEEFTAPELYGNNNYSKEIADVHGILQFLRDRERNFFAGEMAPDCILLIGHSRGGGIALMAAAEDGGVKAVSTWASVDAMKTPWGRWSAQQMEDWKRDGVAYVTNSRTGQRLPLYYQLYEDYLQHAERFDLQRVLASAGYELLVCHGTNDEAVPVQAAHNLFGWHPEAALFLVKSDHVFGRKHPWTQAELPGAMQAVVDATLAFFKRKCPV